MHRVTQPLPWALDHVHCYAVDDAEGWTLIDSGLGTPGTGRRWQEALALLGHPHVRRIVITHYHPDHIGASTRLAEITGAEEIVQGRVDRDLTVRTWLDLEAGARFERWMIAHGTPPEEAARSAEEEDELPIAPVEPTHLVDEGDTLDLAGEPFEVLAPARARRRPHRAARGAQRPAVRRRRPARRDHAQRRRLGRQRAGSAGPLPRHARSHRGARAGDRLPGPSRRDRATGGARAGDRDAPRRRLDDHERALRAGARTAYEVVQHVWGGTLGFHEQRFALAEALALTWSVSSGMGRAVRSSRTAGARGLSPAPLSRGRRARRTWRAGSA